ncbi:MAG TPA: hypothetical protein VJ875_16345 [Pyrinomonadaceae bacterium]|nr:hypothetical protein [Pyrinomonadaceae bacterium]
MDIIISTLKIISMLTAGAFGVLALLTNYKDKSGDITKWGKIALSGVVLSVLLSLFLYGLETSRANAAAKKAKAEAEATAMVLKDILSSAKTTLAQQKLSLDETFKLKSGLDETVKEQMANSQRTIGIAEGMTVALKQQRENLSQSRDIARNMATSLDTQRSLLASQGRIQRQVVRAYYPLEPLTMFYELEYPMDQPALRKYADRVRADIVRWLRHERGDRGTTTDDLHDEDIEFILTAQTQKWKPGDADGEESASKELLRDYTSFQFRQNENPGDRTIVFSSIPADLQGVFVTMPSKGSIKQEIEVRADFLRRVFIKVVRSDNPIRTGNDTLAVSALDLVGRELTWRTFGEAYLKPGPIWHLTRVAFKFPNDYDQSKHLRYITVAQGVESVQITASAVGLAELFAELSVTSKR